MPYKSKLSLSSDSTQALKSQLPSDLIQTPSSLDRTSVASQVVIKLEKLDSNSCDMHNDFKNLSETQWLSSRQVEVKDQINPGSIAFSYKFFAFRDFQILFVLQSVTNLICMKK